VLIVRVGSMGDILHGLPAVAALRQRLPDCFLGWAVEPAWMPLLASTSGDSPGMPIVDRLHGVPTREWKRTPFSVATLRQIAQLRRGMHGEQYDVCIDLQGSIRSACIGRLSGAKRLIGPQHPREPQARALYGERVENRARHVIDQACQLVSAALPDAPRLLPAPVLLPHDLAAEAWCDQILGTHELSHDSLVLLAPTAGWGAKQWPAERFASFARQLRRHGCRVLINAASPDDAVARSVAENGHAELLACSLAQLIAVLRRVRLVVGGDTGPVHLAAALGRPVVALFGPTDPARNGPRFPDARVRVLRHPASRLDHRRHPETEAGLARITVEEVAAQAFELLAAPVPEAPLA
jgi:heptosyltransferase-1